MISRSQLRALTLGSRALNGGAPTIVASFGRAGSSLIAEAAVRSLAETAPLYKLVRGIAGLDHLPAWSLNDLKSVRWVFKTHSAYRPLVPNGARVLYLFDDPDLVVASHLRMLTHEDSSWVAAHFDHFNVGVPQEPLTPLSIFREFRLEENFDSWRRQTAVPTAFVRLNAAWNYEAEISRFLGYPFRMHEPFSARRTEPRGEINDPVFTSFRERLSRMPDFSVINL